MKELDKIIAQIENEHISALPEVQQSNCKSGKKRSAPRIKQEEDHGMEVAFSATSISEKNEP